MADTAFKRATYQDILDLPEGMVGYQIARPAKACLSYLIGAPGDGCIVELGCTHDGILRSGISMIVILIH